MKAKSWEQLKTAFEGTPVEPVLLEMEEELGVEHAYDFVSMILQRTEEIARLWQEGVQRGN